MRWLTNEQPVARKDHNCDACDAWLDSGFSLEDCETPRQRESVQAAEADGWKIRKGQKYRVCRGAEPEGFFTVRARLDMDEVCRALDLYDA